MHMVRAKSNASKRLKLNISLCSYPPAPPPTLTPTTPIPCTHQSPQTIFQLLKNCTRISQIKQTHAQAIAHDLHLWPSVVTALIRSYLSAENLDHARTLFYYHPSPFPPILLWNLIITAFSKINNCQESINLFCRLLALEGPEHIAPDKYTFTSTITSCSYQMSVTHGKIVHGLVIKFGCCSDLYVNNALINMYAVFALLDHARKVFDEMPEKDVFSWTSLVGGYAKRGQIGDACQLFDTMPERNEVSWTVMVSGFVDGGKYVEALKYFSDMLADHNVKPNEAVLVCVISACARLGALDQGSWIHGYIGRSGIAETSNISTALIDMYAKCGRIDCAFRVFNRLPKRDVSNFTSMISGLSIHGLGNDAMGIFSQMLANHVKPNDITVLAILKGCSHAGLVQEGSSIFYNMESLWDIQPKIEHYACYVDLLGRAGDLERALEVVKNMPVEPDIVVWRALLSACRTHRDANLGEQVKEHVAQLDASSDGGGEVLLSNTYAALDQWDRVAMVRKHMSQKTTDPSPGCSWIEVNGVVHEFRVCDKLHPRIEEIRDKLSEVLKKASLGGYVAQTGQVSFELCDEEKEQAVALHSEKLAIAFALLSTEPGTLIRIVKNLRTCGDCHSALKAISQVYDREIVVRDCTRFHTFKQGYCSCNDYW